MKARAATGANWGISGDKTSPDCKNPDTNLVSIKQTKTPMSARIRNRQCRGLFLAVVLFLFSLAFMVFAESPAHVIARLITRVGGVEMNITGGPSWVSAPVNQHLSYNDRLRTLEDGQATLQLQDYSEVRVSPGSELSVVSVTPPPPQSRLQFQKGRLYFLDRNRPREIEVETPVGSAAIVGTEFVVEVNPDSGETVLTLVEGKVVLANAQGRTELSSGEQGIIERGRAPRKTAVIAVQDAVQWFLYYPAVVDPSELALDNQTQALLAGSLAAYRNGDLLKAMAEYPAGHVPASPNEKLYLDALQLASGQVTNYAALLDRSVARLPAGRALEWMIAAVRRQSIDPSPAPDTASQWLADSYYCQSRHDLGGALAAVLRAVAISPKFGFGWERVAELEFSFGRLAKAEKALDRSLAESPRNAQAHALAGFLLLARERREQAEAEFNDAIQIDPLLGNAWLGRGLGRIHAGHAAEGRVDLQTAAILEPDRWLLRSYLGKAYAEEALFAPNSAASRNLHDLAVKELKIAESNDPFDPTPWLYSALIAYNDYRIADAISDLEKSQQLNDNREVYRSRLLLDEDQAVRDANLANIYKDAGMTDVSLEEAAHAVADDYANYSAHLNLASTFDELRDPTRFNLRYESQWFNETLLAGMLAPPGAASLSENLSQQEYSQLFSRERIGLQNTSEYFGSGEFRSTTSQYGAVDGFSWALDLYDQFKRGIRVNNQLSQIDWDTHLKYQITPQDSIYVMTTYEDYNAGDQFQYYDQNEASPSYHLTETQTPMMVAGWHHEWNPGSHTLFLAGRLQDAQQLTDTNVSELAATKNPTVPPGYVPFDLGYSNYFEVYSAELDQILEREAHTDIFGARYQDGFFQAQSTLNRGFAGLPPYSSSTASDNRFQRFTAYEYHHWRITDSLTLIGGLDYDYEEYPLNYRRPPLNSDQGWKSRWSPKAALLWTASPQLSFRMAFSRALGGVSYDESVRLEPTQIAGFDQSFRSVISESLIGSVEAADYQIAGAAMDWKPRSDTWVTLQADTLRELVGQDAGYFLVNFGNSPSSTTPLTDPARVNYHETDATLTVNHIVATDLFLQAQYKFAYSDLKMDSSGVLAPAGYSTEQDQWGMLHQGRLSALWQSPTGFFARAELLCNGQALGGNSSMPPGDTFAQVNLYGGYRLRNRRGDVTLGVLNLSDGGYHLSPINYYLDLPYQRLLYARIRLNF
jgi:tetratricopeptide (TPR) repeat protein